MSAAQVQAQAVKERPILFSAPMVRAILKGSKTQTRRIVKAPVLEKAEAPTQVRLIGDVVEFRWHGPKTIGGFTVRCPYGQPGDRLWVRETWSKAESHFSHELFYKADGDHQPGKQLALSYVEREDRWRPSIHMPRAASRIILEITGVRVERLQDIDAADADREGLLFNSDRIGPWSGDGDRWWCGPREAFADLWQHINGPGSWYANPWVWVIEFRKLEQQRDWLEVAR